MSKPVIRLNHAMARSGGTVISQCLGSMNDVVLLSEVHPRGLSFIDPVFQANKWFGLLTPNDRRRVASMTHGDYLDLIALIQQRCEERAKTLVIRDWTHLDFTGVPFVSPPSYKLTHAATLTRYFTVVVAASVRHPIDQWLSLRSREMMRGVIGLESYLRGYRRFAEFCVRIGNVRYEDFARNPDVALEALCANLDLPFDPGYESRWSVYTKVTGDIRPFHRGAQIKLAPRRHAEAGLLEQFAANSDYRSAIDLLGYAHPR